MSESAMALVKTSKDPRAHLATLASFARLTAPPESANRLVELSKLALPYVDRFLSGERTDDVYSELTALLPRIQESLKALSDLIAPALGTSVFMRGVGWDMRAMIHAGAHVQAAVWGLLPDDPEAVANPPSNGKGWKDLLEWNMQQCRTVLAEAAELDAAWRQIISEAARTTNGASGGTTVNEKR